MNFIVMLFYFSTYAIVVLSGVWVYGKFFKKIPQKQEWNEYVQNIGVSSERVVENNYLLKSELTSKMMFFIFFIFGILTSLSPIVDSLDEFYRRMALGTAIFGIIFTLVTKNRMLHKLITNTINIKEFEDSLVYEYVTVKGEIKTDTILKDHIYSITWSIFPYVAKSKDIWITEAKEDIKRWGYVFAPFYLFLSLFYWLLYLVLNKFKIEQYILFRTENGIFSIPSTKLKLKKSVDFEWKSLINRFITNGGSYAE